MSDESLMTRVNGRTGTRVFRHMPALLLLCVILFAALSLTGSRLGAKQEEWKQAKGSWSWDFPRDHGSHPEFRTEWWYFTGNLKDVTGKRYGYQLTFFREGIVQEKNPQNAWSLRDLYLAHFTLTDAAAQRFSYAERVSRSGPGLAGAAHDRMNVWLLSWSATMAGDTIRIEARNQKMELALNLTPAKPIAFHGENGLSRKGPGDGQASYYYSYTNLKTEGRVSMPGSPSSFVVHGTSWFDHEFGSNQLASDQQGWDWFSMHLSDRQDLMLYLLRRKDGSVEPSSSGTLVDQSGKATHLKLTDVTVEVLDRWKSARSGATYPSRWRIRIPDQGLELDVSPLVAAQELITEGSTRIIYWEGAVMGRGRSTGKEITCEGYVEMTGYAAGMGGVF